MLARRMLHIDNSRIPCRGGDARLIAGLIISTVTRNPVSQSMQLNPMYGIVKGVVGHGQD